MKKTITALVVAATVALLAGCGTGKANEAVQNAPQPTVTTTQTVAEVPQACLDALDNADQGFTYAGQIMTAAGTLDADTMSTITTQLEALAPTYNANKAACRAAGN